AAAIFDREADARRQRHVRADDAMAAEEVEALVEHVHRAAFAARATIDASEQLRHHDARAHSARKRLAVITVGGDDVIVVAEQGDRARAHGLLADVQMTKAADLA